MATHRVIEPGVDNNGQTLEGVATPVDDTDASNKAYVDSLKSPVTIPKNGSLDDYITSDKQGIYNIDFDDSALGTDPPTWAEGSQFPTSAPYGFVDDGAAGKVLNASMTVTSQDGYIAQIFTWYVNTGNQKTMLRSPGSSWIYVFDGTGTPVAPSEQAGLFSSNSDGTTAWVYFGGTGSIIVNGASGPTSLDNPQTDNTVLSITRAGVVSWSVVPTFPGGYKRITGSGVFGIGSQTQSDGVIVLDGTAQPQLGSFDDNLLRWTFLNRTTEVIAIDPASQTWHSPTGTLDILPGGTVQVIWINQGSGGSLVQEFWITGDLQTKFVDSPDGSIEHEVALTQAAYDAITTPDSKTAYDITDAS